MPLGLGEGLSMMCCSFEGVPQELQLTLNFKPGHRFAGPECVGHAPTHEIVVKSEVWSGFTALSIPPAPWSIPRLGNSTLKCTSSVPNHQLKIAKSKNSLFYKNANIY